MSRQASRQTGKQAGKQAVRQAGMQAGPQAGRQAGWQALGRHSVGAMPWRGLLALTGALREAMSSVDHPLISADHPLLSEDHHLFCDIIQMVLKGGAQEGVLMRGCS